MKVQIIPLHDLTDDDIASHATSVALRKFPSCSLDFVYVLLHDHECLAVLLIDYTHLHHITLISGLPDVDTLVDAAAAFLGDDTHHFLVAVETYDDSGFDVLLKEKPPCFYTAAKGFRAYVYTSKTHVVLFCQQHFTPRFQHAPHAVVSILLAHEKNITPTTPFHTHMSIESSSNLFKVTFEPPVIHWMAYDDSSVDCTLAIDTTTGCLKGGTVRIEKFGWFGGGHANLFTTYSYSYGIRLSVLSGFEISDGVVPTRYPREHNALVDALTRIHSGLRRSATLIARAWKLAISCPDYTLCRNRLHLEFLGLTH